VDLNAPVSTTGLLKINPKCSDGGSIDLFLSPILVVVVVVMLGGDWLADPSWPFVTQYKFRCLH
jgi:hypothetical protein